MDEKKKRTIMSIVGMVALLLVCVIGVQMVFAGLGVAFSDQGDATSGPGSQGDSVQSSSEQDSDSSEASSAVAAQPAPSFCPFCGEGLPSSFQWGQYCPYCGEQVEA